MNGFHFRRLRDPARQKGQALIEYLLMMLMLLFVFTGLYRVLSGEVKNKMFRPAGKVILRSYWKGGT